MQQTNSFIALQQHIDTLLNLRRPTQVDPVLVKPIFKTRKRKNFIYRSYSVHHKMTVLQVYYGSDTSFDKPIFSVTKVAAMFNMPITSVYKIINDFRSNSFDFSKVRSTFQLRWFNDYFD